MQFLSNPATCVMAGPSLVGLVLALVAAFGPLGKAAATALFVIAAVLHVVSTLLVALICGMGSFGMDGRRIGRCVAGFFLVGALVLVARCIARTYRGNTTGGVIHVAE